MPLIKRIDTPTDEEVNHIADLITRAFDGTDDMAAMVGGDVSLIDEFQRAFVRASALEGDVYVVIDEETRVAASVAVWFGPGRAVFDSEAQRALGFDEVFAKFSEEANTWHIETYGGTVERLEKDFFTDEERKKRWWLYMLATDPKHQKKGYASALIADELQRLKELDPENSSGLVATKEANVKFYRGVGYEYLTYTSMESAVGTIDMHVMTNNKPAPKFEN